MMKTIVYTAIIGNKDTLQEIEGKHYNCDFVCFTDDKDLKSNTWDIEYVTPISTDNRLSAKPFKILPHYYFPDYTYSIWMDGTFIPKKDVSIQNLISTYLKNTDIATFKHINALRNITDNFYRNCAYKEAEVCLQHKLDDPSKIITQVEKYKKLGFPNNKGLHACSIILRKHYALQDAMNEWWIEVCLSSIRDQISFPYILWANSVDIETIKGNLYYDNEYFSYTPHKKIDQHNTGREYSTWLEHIRYQLQINNLNIFNLYKIKEIPFFDWYNSGKTIEETITLLKKWEG